MLSQFMWKNIYIGWDILKNPVKRLNILCQLTRMTLGFWRAELQNKEKAFFKILVVSFPLNEMSARLSFTTSKGRARLILTGRRLIILSSSASWQSCLVKQFWLQISFYFGPSKQKQLQKSFSKIFYNIFWKSAILLKRRLFQISSKTWRLSYTSLVKLSK